MKRTWRTPTEADKGRKCYAEHMDEKFYVEWNAEYGCWARYGKPHILMEVTMVLSPDWSTRRREQRKEDFYDHISAEVRAIVQNGEAITPTQWGGMRVNSYERRGLSHLFNDELLLQQIKYYADQEGISPAHEYEIAGSYQGTLLREYLPELVKRFSGTLHALCPDGSLLPVDTHHPEEGMCYVRDGASLLAYSEEEIKLFREVN